MKILIDIGHPAHVHYFRNFSKIMEKKGNNVLFVTRKRGINVYLMKFYNLKFLQRNEGGKNIFSKVFNGVFVWLKLFHISLKFKPDIFLSQGGIYTSIVAWALNKPSITFSDTENSKWSHRISYPFTSVVLTPTCFEKDLGKKQIFYDGVMELAYLNRNCFQKDNNILNELGITNNEKYTLIRFVSWDAHHDVGHNGISMENKKKCVDEFKKYCKVFISSEGKLPAELEKYQIKIKPHKMHDVISNASLVFSESATMASESAVLGVPAIFLDNEGRGYSKHEEEFGLVYNYSESLKDQISAIDKGVKILKNEHTDEIMKINCARFLEDKIDVTQFYVWFVENFPESANRKQYDNKYFNRIIKKQN